MATGVTVAEETVALYNVFKLRKTNHRYIMMHIDNGLIKVNHTGDKNSELSQEDEFNNFLETLPSDIGRYIMIDLAIPQKNGAVKDSMFLISWNPDGASTKSNILYTMSKRALTDKVREGMTEIQANDKSDLVYEEILKRGSK